MKGFKSKYSLLKVNLLIKYQLILMSLQENRQKYFLVKLQDKNMLNKCLINIVGDMKGW